MQHDQLIQLFEQKNWFWRIVNEQVFTMRVLLLITLLAFFGLSQTSSAQEAQQNPVVEQSPESTSGQAATEFGPRIEAVETSIADLDSRIDTLEESSKQNSTFAWLTLFVAVAAALAGAWLGGHMSDRSARRSEARALDLRKKDASIKVCAEWIAMSPQIARVVGILDQITSELTADEFNDVSEYGNWLEMVLLMRRDKLLDSTFLDNFNFNEKVAVFRGKVQAAQAKDSRLTDSLTSWENLANS